MSVPFETAAAFAGLSSIRHGFFGRQDGVSENVFSSLNVSETGGDEPARVAENRARIAYSLDVPPHALATLKQVHSNFVLTLTALPAAGSRPEADAIVTALPGIALGIQTADCTPILFADAEAGIIGAAHAGWKGAVGAIALKTMEAMVALGAERSRIVAAIGPTISHVNYEVGPEFAAPFLAEHPDAERHFSTPENGREHFDLPGFIEAQLSDAGIGMVENLKACTYAAPDRYFSHRYATHRNQTTGRQMSAIIRR
jgi:YfiH family protein